MKIKKVHAKKAKVHGGKERPITGRESSLLALLVQGVYTGAEKRRVLVLLSGRALRIARVLLGETKGSSKADRDAAQGLRDWAKGLRRKK